MTHSIPLTRGWNLISFPYTPVRPALADVFQDTSVSVVLSYWDGEWVTAVNEDGLWTGTLGEVSGGYGYWVMTPTDEELVVTMKGSARVRIIQGWNLLGVIGEEERDADAYFDALDWRVANTLEAPVEDVDNDGSWQKIRRGEHGTLYPHKGYWVWSNGSKPVSIHSSRRSRQRQFA